MEEWRDGEACRDKCIQYYKTNGSGCCEARHRDGKTRSYCRFYLKGEIGDGLGDAKATLCTGNHCTTLIFSIYGVENIFTEVLTLVQF